jgi:hypothetical protein
MKRVLFLLFLLSFTLCKAQRVRLTDTSNSWVVEHQGGDYLDIHRYSFRNDTMINGIQYRILTDSTWHSGFWPTPWASYSATAGFLREDTLSKKVFFIPSAAMQEKVLYDWNVAVGDTVTSGDSVYIVVQLDSFTLNNNWHKRWQLDPLVQSSFSSAYEILEGVGSTNGIFNFPEDFESQWRLTCFSNKDIFQSTAPAYVSSISCKLPLAVVGLPTDINQPPSAQIPLLISLLYCYRTRSPQVILAYTI